MNCLVCETCHVAQPDDELLVCDKCDHGFHMRCLRKVCTPGSGRRLALLMGLTSHVRHLLHASSRCMPCRPARGCVRTVPSARAATPPSPGRTSRTSGHTTLPCARPVALSRYATPETLDAS